MKLLPLFFLFSLFVSCENPNTETEEIVSIDGGIDTTKPIAIIATDTLKEFVKDNYTVTDRTAKKLLREISSDNSILKVFSPLLNEVPFTDITYKEKPLFSEQPSIPDFTLPVELTYDQQVVSTFTDFAQKTGGKAYNVNLAKEIPKVLIDILNNHTKSNTDVVFLIDKSTSMWDDIAAVKRSTTKMIEALDRLQNVRVGWAAYADSVGDGDRWFEIHDLSPNLNKIIPDIKNLDVFGGGLDFPESVNDAIIKTVREMNWKKGSKRMMIVLGDAPSLLPPASQYTHANVIEKCIENDIWVNIYPVIIHLNNGYPDLPVSVNGGEVIPPDTLERKTYSSDVVLINNVFPNPATDNLNIVFNGLRKCRLVVTSLTGQRLLDEFVDNTRYTIDISAYAAGSYTLTAIDLITKQRSTEIVIKK